MSKKVKKSAPKKAAKKTTKAKTKTKPLGKLVSSVAVTNNKTDVTSHAGAPAYETGVTTNV